MAEKTKSSEMPASLEVFMVGVMIGSAGAAILAGPGGLLLFVGLVIMAVGMITALQEGK